MHFEPYFLLSVFFIIGINCRAQKDINTLKNLFESGDYKTIISYTKEIEDSKNGELLVLLGDSYMKKADLDEKVNQNYYQQSLYMQAMAIAQGIYFDMTLTLNLYNSGLQQVLEKRLKAINLYSTASNLGYTAATQRLVALGRMNNQISSSLPSTSSTTTNNQRTASVCSNCNGTGRISTNSTPTYGYGGTHWCNTCNREVSNTHCCQCKICPSCGGKGSK